MWLIDNTTLHLRFVDDETVERYAILSHTWEDGQEVTFQDMAPDAQARVAHKRGYAKIRETCRLARADGLRYSWVDTCCIDKSSDSNLSAAINSMYRWYAAAEVCYVFVADLQLNLGPQLLDMRLPQCRYFTRGWTLQELIAPARIKFFDSAWRSCGSKDDEAMLQRLSRITNIPTAVLRSPDEYLSQVPVAQKMSWAAKRQTTVPEDAAYSLLGIFDISMPMIYGEGGPRAFLRLQQEIMKETRDFSLLAWEVEDNGSFQPHGVFAKSPAAFQGSAKIAPSDN
ncbi:heterokaryon incompatibility protein-domain-containing protein, partial [Microdochium trichocladiopsis]